MRSNQRPDTLMQDRSRQNGKTSCDARPDHPVLPSVAYSMAFSFLVNPKFPPGLRFGVPAFPCMVSIAFLR